MSYYGSKKRKALSRAINCMLGAAVFAGGMFGNTGIVSSAEEPTAMYKGGTESGTCITPAMGSDEIVIKDYSLDDVMSGEYKAYYSGANFYGRYVMGPSGDGVNGKITMLQYS